MLNNTEYLAWFFYVDLTRKNHEEYDSIHHSLSAVDRTDKHVISAEGKVSEPQRFTFQAFCVIINSFWHHILWKGGWTFTNYVISFSFEWNVAINCHNTHYKLFLMTRSVDLHLWGLKLIKRAHPQKVVTTKILGINGIIIMKVASYLSWAHSQNPSFALQMVMANFTTVTTSVSSSVWICVTMRASLKHNMFSLRFWYEYC